MAKKEFGGEHRGIPHLAKNERDMGHPALSAGTEFHLERDPANQSTGISALMFRFTAVAMMRSWSMSLSNCSGNSDCAPSDNALSGLGWTSIRSPSQPAATAARAMGATLSRRPTPCEGSASIGRCESFLITGMAEMSMVLRV